MLLSLLPSLAFGQYDLELELLASGYQNPAGIVNAGDERLFVVEQVGRINILYIDGTKETTPFLDISSQVSSGGEKGLLGLAFAPDYCTSGRFYVNYTFTEGGQLKTRISRFNVNPNDKNDGLEDSEESLIEFDQPFSNHNGGQVEFGPDGYLYIGTGDGGSGGDPQNNAQNITRWLGKLLRIDVSTATGYSIPDDNPFASNELGLDEIWSFGLRNPWKFAFDAVTGDLYIGDVGQNSVEEVDFQPAGSAGGANFGWRCYEGNSPYELSGCSGITDFVDPVFTYSQASSSRCSVTGGRVYRGGSFENIIGKYILTDLCSGEYWILWQENEEWQNFYGASLSGGLVAFGSDAWGEMYAVRNGNGEIYRVLESSGTLLDHIVFEGYNTIKSSLAGSAYAWYLNGELIEGATDQTLVFSENGEYYVVITSETGCEITSNPIMVANTGLVDNKAIKSFKAYPNPASDLLNISIETYLSLSENLHIELFTVDGKKVMDVEAQKNNTFSPLNIGKLNPGIYFLFCKNGNGEVLATRKLMIN